MAHPKVAAIARQSVLAASTAALMAGPLALAGSAQSIDSVTDSTSQVLDLTCAEAKETGEDELIKEFCPEEEESTSGGSVTEAVSGETEKVQKSVESAVKESPDADAGGDSGTTESVPKTPVTDSGSKTGGSKVGPSGSTFRPVDSGDSGTAGKSNRSRARARAEQAAGPSFDAHGPFQPGMRSYSELTLQPFAAPVVSVPPIYELPQIAQQMFGDTAAVGAEDPMAAGSATATSAAGFDGDYTAMSADAQGWLAATATGLIMLVGVGHALAGGRTPKRQRA